MPTMNIRGNFTMSKGAFVPTDIAGCVLWVKADAITGLGDGDHIPIWEDQSGNGNDLSHADSAYQPVYRINIVNGLPVVSWEGSSRNLHSTSGPTISQPQTIFIVLNAPNHTAVQVFFSDEADAPIFFLQSDNTLNGGSPYVATVGTYNDAWHYVCYIMNSTSSKIYVDGIQDDDGGDGGIHDLVGFRVGAMNDGSYIYQGDLAEVIVYDTGLSNVNRQLVEVFLANKYAI